MKNTAKRYLRTLANGLLSHLGFELKKIIRTEQYQSMTVTVGSFPININSKSGLGLCYLYHKDYGSQLMRLTALLFKAYPSLSAIDVGANQGDSVALIKSGADIPVISIEGDLSLETQFLANTRNFNDVLLLKTFLTDHPETLNCTYSNIGHNLTITPSTSSAQSVRTDFLTLDHFFEQKVIGQNCKLLKIDTEGFDLKIIRGGRDFINCAQPAILFEFNRENLSEVDDDPFEIFSWLETLGYQFILFYESDGRFMFSSVLSDHQLVKQVFDYVDGKNAKVFYLDIIVFHSYDNELAKQFILNEENYRLNNS